MKRPLLLLLALSVLTVSSCIWEPYGERRVYYNGGRNDGDHEQHDYGRRVWRE